MKKGLAKKKYIVEHPTFKIHLFGDRKDRYTPVANFTILANSDQRLKWDEDIEFKNRNIIQPFTDIKFHDRPKKLFKRLLKQYQLDHVELDKCLMDPKINQFVIKLEGCIGFTKYKGLDWKTETDRIERIQTFLKDYSDQLEETFNNFGLQIHNN